MSESSEPAEKWRANYVPAPHFYNLNQACALINRAFTEGMCYHVGSSLAKRDYRDVDVRLMLPDAEYDRIFGSGDWANAYWSLLCTSISLWLKQQTDLPVDFQIQRQSAANDMHKGRRSALGIFLDYPGERPTDVQATKRCASLSSQGLNCQMAEGHDGEHCAIPETSAPKRAP